MGLKGELELLRMLKKFDVNCEHRLDQSKITDFLLDSDPETREKCKSILRKNRMLPRESLTFQIDILVWKDNHWAALALEQKGQNGVKKVLDINEKSMTMKALCDDGVREYKRSAKNLFLQCVGESFIGEAFCLAKGIEKEVIPVGVVDYEIVINSEKKTNWVYHKGVFFVNKNYFKDFFEEYMKDKSWIRKVVETDPKIAYPDDSGDGLVFY